MTKADPLAEKFREPATAKTATKPPAEQHDELAREVPGKTSQQNATRAQVESADRRTMRGKMESQTKT